MSKIQKNRYAEKRAAAINAHMTTTLNQAKTISGVTPEMTGQQKKEFADLSEMSLNEAISFCKTQAFLWNERVDKLVETKKLIEENYA